MSQNSDSGVISKTLYHQLKGQRKGNTKPPGEDQQWLTEVSYDKSVLSCDGSWWEEKQGQKEQEEMQSHNPEATKGTAKGAEG